MLRRVATLKDDQRHSVPLRCLAQHHADATEQRAAVAFVFAEDGDDTRPAGVVMAIAPRRRGCFARESDWPDGQRSRA
jgi:hypothetical protein